MTNNLYAWTIKNLLMKKEDFLVILAGLNVFGFLSFLIYYGAQLMKTFPLLWLFVPDCQLSALFFALALLSRKDWLVNLGFAAAIKYGFWTLLVMLSFMNYYLTPENAIEYWIIIASHIVLMLEAFLLSRKLKSGRALIPAFTFLFLNDFSDYVLGTHPPLPDYAVPLMSIATPLITVSIIVLIYLIQQRALHK